MSFLFARNSLRHYHLIRAHFFFLFFLFSLLQSIDQVPENEVICMSLLVLSYCRSISIRNRFSCFFLSQHATFAVGGEFIRKVIRLLKLLVAILCSELYSNMKKEV